MKPGFPFLAGEEWGLLALELLGGDLFHAALLHHSATGSGLRA